MAGKFLRLIASPIPTQTTEEEKSKYQDFLIAKYAEMMPIRYAQSTIPTFKSSLNNYLPWLDDRGLYLWDMKNQHYDEFAKHLEANIRKATIVHYNFHISNFYEWIVSRYGDEIKQKYGISVRNPVDEWNTPKRKGEEEELPELPEVDVVNYYFQKEKQELAVAIQNRDQRNALILARQMTAEKIMQKAGLRVAEVANLDVGDIFLEDMLIIVRKGKGNKDRIVDLCSELASLLKWYLTSAHPMRAQGKQLPAEIPLFISEQKKRISRKTVQHRLWKQQEEYGVPLDKRFSPHGFRRLFATELYKELTNAGHVDPLTYIKVQLGHRYYNTTLGYCRIPQAIISRATQHAYNTIKRELGRKAVMENDN